tara:strand:- start:1973 stop:2896 length:924 start_codon:yes stop_codon:yes gene_type:complete
MNSYNKHVKIDTKNWEQLALNSLENDGLVVLRGFSKSINIKKINNKVKSILDRPSILGSVGYYQKDPNKKTYDGLLLGKEVVNFVANKSVLKLVESYVDDEIVLNEIMLKNDLGNYTQYFPYHRHTGADVEGPKNKPFGCGAILYLHDTEAGAFCYSIKSHKLKIEQNPESNLSKHKKKKELEINMLRINGKKGDLVIFDERGFHGPEQPVKTPRTVLLYGFQSKIATLNKSRTGIPVVISDLKDLDENQLKSIGIGGGTRAEYENYHLRKSVNYTKKYRFLIRIIKILSWYNKFWTKFKHKIKSLK